MEPLFEDVISIPGARHEGLLPHIYFHLKYMQ